MMIKTIRLWQKNKDYFVTGVLTCDECEKPLDHVAVILWLDKKMRCLHIGCHKKQKAFRKVKSVFLASVIDERPSGAVYVNRPFDYLADSNQLNNNLFDGGVKVIDKTVYAGRESFEGSRIGLVSDKKSLKLDKEILLLKNKTKKLRGE